MTEAINDHVKHDPFSVETYPIEATATRPVQSEDWTGRQPATPNNLPVPATTDWDNPMLKSFKGVFSDLANTVVRASELATRVDHLQRTVDALQDTQTELMAERTEARARLKEANAKVGSLEYQVHDLQAALDYTKESLLASQQAHDKLRTEHNLLLEDHDHLRDDHDLAVLEKQDWIEKHDKVSAAFDALAADLNQSRGLWFAQEDKLQEQIKFLAAERNMYRDKFDACKSHAAKIMALDQVRAEPPPADPFH